MDDYLFEPQHGKTYLLKCSPKERLKSACTSAQSDLSLHCSYEETASLAVQNAPSANGQVDLNLSGAYISESTFSDIMAYLCYFILDK